MNQENLFSIVENQNKEYYDLINSKYYRIGHRLCVFIEALSKLEIKKIIKMISEKIASIKLKKFDVINKSIITKKNNANYKEKKIAVYTCIIGKYDEVQIPNFNFDNLDYFLITDNEREYKKYGDYYKIININDYNQSDNNILKNRFAKLNPNIFFQDYDYSIYLDGNIKVISDIRSFINYVNKNVGLAMHLHRQRNCIYKEAIACKLLKRGNYKAIKKQVDFYKEQRFPENYGLLEANVIVCDLKNKVMQKIMHDWWLEFKESNSFRDQLSLPYVLWKNNILVSDVGTLGNNVYKNYKLRINTHL